MNAESVLVPYFENFGKTSVANTELSTNVGEIPLPTPTPEILHTLVGSYYLTNENIDAKLLLNNKGNEPLEVRPTLYNKQGQELQVAPVIVEPQSFQLINISNWVTLGGDSFKAGNIKLLHYGKDLVLGAQIYLTDHARSLSYEEKLTELGKFDTPTRSRLVDAVEQCRCAGCADKYDQFAVDCNRTARQKAKC